MKKGVLNLMTDARDVAKAISNLALVRIFRVLFQLPIFVFHVPAMSGRRWVWGRSCTSFLSTYSPTSEVEVDKHLQAKCDARWPSDPNSWGSLVGQNGESAWKQADRCDLGGALKIAQVSGLSESCFCKRNKIVVRSFDFWVCSQNKPWAKSVFEVNIEGKKIVPTKPKMYLTCSIELVPGSWVKLC